MRGSRGADVAPSADEPASAAVGRLHWPVAFLEARSRSHSACYVAVRPAWGLPDTHVLHTWVRSGDPTHQVITAHVTSSATDAEYALSLGTHLTATLVFASPSRRAPTASVSLLHVAVAATPDGTALIGVDPIFEDSSHGYTDHPLALDLYRADVAGVVSPIGSVPGFAAKGGDPVHLLVSSRQQLAAWTHLASRTYVATVT